MQRSFIVVAASLLLIAACMKRPPPPAAPAVAQTGAAPASPDTPAARIGTQVITLGEVDKSIVADLRKIEFTRAMKIHEVRTKSLDTIIAERLLGAKAKARNQTVQQYVTAEVEKTVPPSSDAEAKKFYDENTAQMGGASFEEMKARIHEYLTGSQRQEAAHKILEEARKAASVKVLIEEPMLPRVKVAAVGPSKGPANAPITLVEFSDFQ